jgi:hypothetical protein
VNKIHLKYKLGELRPNPRPSPREIVKTQVVAKSKPIIISFVKYEFDEASFGRITPF